MPINSVVLANTFNEFRTTVNEVITTVNGISGGSGVINATTIIGGTLTANNLTSGRLTLATSGGQLTDDSALTYDTSTDILTLAGTTDASSSTTGTLKVAGGVGVAKKLYVGTDFRVEGNATFAGNVYFLGANTEVSTTQLNVNDSLLQLANNNTSDAIDIGLFGQYNSGSGNVHSGLFRDASDGTWKLFQSYNVEPTTTIDITGNGYALANLQIGTLNSGAITSTGTVTATLFSGSGASLTALNASNLSSGLVATARLASSGTADATTFLRGDSTWASAAVSITNNTTTDSTFYPIFTSVTSGSIVGANTSSSKLTFNPSSGLLTSTDYNSSSDITLKENFTPIVNPLDIISQLEGFGFNWIDTKEKSYGLSAQQVESVLPEVVRVRPDGTKGINYLNLIAFLVEGIKDLKEEIRQLKSYK